MDLPLAHLRASLPILPTVESKAGEPRLSGLFPSSHFRNSDPSRRGRGCASQVAELTEVHRCRHRGRRHPTPSSRAGLGDGRRDARLDRGLRSTEYKACDRSAQTDGGQPGWLAGWLAGSRQARQTSKARTRSPCFSKSADLNHEPRNPATRHWPGSSSDDRRARVRQRCDRRQELPVKRPA